MQKELAVWPGERHLISQVLSFLTWVARGLVWISSERSSHSNIPWFLEESTGFMSSNPTQDGETGPTQHLRPSGQTLASLRGGWRSEAAEATLSVSFSFRREQSRSSRGKPFGFGQCGVCLMTGTKDYCRMRVLSGRDSEHRIKDGRKAKRSVGPVPCLCKAFQGRWLSSYV